MIYLDTSVLLAHLLAEDRSPPERLWDESLDALHLASADFLRSQGVPMRVASYDERLLEGARAIDLPVLSLD